MAATPSVADLQALIATLQAQVNALSTAAPAAAAPTPVVFADMPQTLNSDDLIITRPREDQASMSKDARHSKTKHSPTDLG
jgi:hypothetical protein